MKIHTYKIAIAAQQDIVMPEDANFLDIQVREDKPVMWWEVDETSTLCKRTIFIFGPNNDIPDDGLSYLGTVQLGSLVWHFYLKK